MNFTREPVVETVMTPREGYKLVVRSSRGAGHEEFFVDALEVVSFGSALFFRSLERPKNFLLPVSDYEILEVRETRMVLKTPSAQEKGGAKASAQEADDGEGKGERKRRRSRRRRGRDRADGEAEEGAPEKKTEEPAVVAKEKPKEVKPSESPASEPTIAEKPPEADFSSLLPPPTTLISDNIERYKEMMEVEPAPPSADEEAPEIVTPEPQKSSPSKDDAIEQLEGFSASKFLRKLTGAGETSGEE